jgi:hypothetical protein
MNNINETKSIFAKVIYLDKDKEKEAEKEAKKKIPQTSYVQNLLKLKLYKKKGGKVKYEGDKPSSDVIKKNVEKDVKRLRSEASLEIDLTEAALKLFISQDLKLIESSNDEDITSLKEELETFAYVFGDEDFEKDFFEADAGTKENVKLNKPFRTPGGPKKFSVYVKNDKGNIVKVNFGDPNMEIKRDNSERRKSFRARHNCDNPGPKWKARYWACKTWEGNKKVSEVVSSEKFKEEDFKNSFASFEEYTESIEDFS